jgi:peptide/nickel transport system permease protein
MISYIFRRILTSIPTLLMIMVIGYFIMELPPGDYLTRYVQQLEAQGQSGAREQGKALRERYNMDDPAYVRFGNWFFNFFRGEYGDSFAWGRTVKEVIGPRLGMTIMLSILVVAFSWGIGIPIGVYSATKQYSFLDHVLTLGAFIGLGIPPFMVTLMLLLFGFNMTGEVLTGFFSQDMLSMPWSWLKFLDLMKHLWIPLVVAATTGTAWVLRIMRGNLLDELKVNYVQAARARGLSERLVIWKHAVRNALHPLVMAFGGSFSWTISNFAIVSIVLDLPTLDPIYLQATREQDIYLAGTILVMVGFLNVAGNLFADIMLAWLDPRVRFE